MHCMSHFRHSLLKQSFSENYHGFHGMSCMLIISQTPCDSYPSTQNWLEQVDKSQGDCLARDYVSTLPEEPYTDFTQSGLSDLTTLWGQFGILEKQKFCETYGDITSFILVPIEEPVLRAALRF